MEKKMKDRWDKADILFKSIAGILIPITIVSLGFFGNRFLQKRQENEERTRLYSELMTNREESESALRKDMFTSILKSFLDEKANSPEEEVLNLELLAYNFHESLNLKPLFVHLQNKIKKNTQINKEEKNNYFQRLERVSRDIIAKQMYILEEVGCTFDLTINLKDFKNTSSNPIQIQSNEIELEGIGRRVETEVIGVDLDEKKVLIRLWITTLPSSELYYVQASWIGLFDFPTISAIRLSNDQRFSMVLTSFDDATAEITLVYFPGSYASLKDKPYYEDVVKKLKSNDSFNKSHVK